MKDKFTVPRIQPGDYAAKRVIVSKNHRALILLADGSVVVAGYSSFDVSRDHACSEENRRAFTKLTGITGAEIKAIMRKRNENNRKFNAVREVRILRRQAIKAGYKLVKVKS